MKGRNTEFFGVMETKAFSPANQAMVFRKKSVFPGNFRYALLAKVELPRMAREP